MGILGSDDEEEDEEEVLVEAIFLFGGGCCSAGCPIVALRSPGRLVTELLSAERLILLALSELDLSWPPPLADLMCLLAGPLGGGGLRQIRNG